MPDQWNFADVWETIADAVPGRIAQHHGRRHDIWRDFDTRADGIAVALLRAGLKQQDKVALHLHNAPEYLETAFAAMKAGLVPVNTNYRYVEDELVYLWDNADASAVVFHGSFTDRVDTVRLRCPAVRVWLHVDDGTTSCPAWASPYEAAARAAPGRVRPPWGRSGDDLVLIYTGGTTGMPRGVMWRQHDLFLASNTTGDPETADPGHIRARLGIHGLGRSAPPVGLPAAPLMHGTGFVFAATILNRGGAVLTLPGQSFDPVALLDAMQASPVTDLCIVGDAFCRPIVDALDRNPGRWDLPALKVVSSSGMVWSADVKQRLLLHAPGVLMIDFLNSSEASGLGRSLTSAKRSDGGARFRLGDNAFVIDDKGAPVTPGSGVAGRLAVRGRIPLGYYKDPDKTAATFPVIGGVRCAIPGDYAMVEADGSILLLGRGSLSINTGGEKVFPEEVEQVMKTYPRIHDAVVVGLPDERFGQVVAAMVEAPAWSAGDRDALIEHARRRLASHKVPRIIMPVASVERGPNGKASYPDVARRISEWLHAMPNR